MTTTHKYNYSIVSEQGPKGFMEDTYYVEKEEGWMFAGAYDGHKGAEVAEHARKFLHRYFFKELEDGESPGEAFKKAYIRTSEDMENSTAGSTASDVYIKNNTIYWANAGDGGIIVISEQGEAKQISEFHRMDNPEERKRVEKNGGIISGEYVMKGPFGIQPTRALGDSYFRDVGIISEPSTGEYRIKDEDKWLVVGTDGLFDYAEAEEIGSLLMNFSDPDSAGEALRKKVLNENGGHDNTTFIVISLTNER